MLSHISSSCRSLLHRARPSLTASLSPATHLTRPNQQWQTTADELCSHSTFNATPARFATKKGGGSTQNSQDSAGRRLGLKIAGGAPCKHGGILIRQRGTKTHAGQNVGIGVDHTLYALCDGYVCFTTVHRPERTFHRERKYINVIPPQEGTQAYQQAIAELKAEYKLKEQAHAAEIIAKRKGTRAPTSRQLYERSVMSSNRATAKEAKLQAAASG